MPRNFPFTALSPLFGYKSPLLEKTAAYFALKSIFLCSNLRDPGCRQTVVNEHFMKVSLNVVQLLSKIKVRFDEILMKIKCKLDENKMLFS